MNAEHMATVKQLVAGTPGMLENAEAIAEYLKAMVEKREPEHDLEEVAEWAEDLCADIATVEAELEGMLPETETEAAK